jgi:hypothetical protein
MIEELTEELKKWDRAQMIPLGYPHFMEGVPGIPIDMLQQQVLLQTLVDFVKHHFDLTDNEFTVQFEQHYADRLKAVREANEDRIKKERALAPSLAVAQKRLLGPNGEPLQ